MVRLVQLEGYVSQKQHDLLNQYVIKCNKCNITFNSSKAMTYLNNNCLPRSTKIYAAEEDYMWAVLFKLNDFENNNVMNGELLYPELISVGFNTTVPQGTTWNDLTNPKYTNRYLGRGAKLCDFASSMNNTFNEIVANLKEESTPSSGQTRNRLVDYTIVNFNDPTADTPLKKTSVVSWSRVDQYNGSAILVYGNGVKTELV